MINILDLFSGAGGLTEGFRNDKFNILSHVEMDPAACKTILTREAFCYFKKTNNINPYERYLQQQISHSDLLSLLPKSTINKVINLEISKQTLPKIFKLVDNNRRMLKVNGIIGGPPCQAYSTIGRSRNEFKKNNDTRIYLYKFYIEFIKMYKPDFYIFENVKGLYSFKDIDGKKLLPKIENEFKSIDGKNSYTFDFKTINSSDYGIPQNRERIIVFGHRKGFSKVNFFKVLEKYKATPPTINELFSDLPNLKAGETNNVYKTPPYSTFVKNHLRTESLPLTQNQSRPNNKNDLAIYKIVAKEKQLDNNVKYCDLPEKLITHKKKNIFLDRFKSLKGDGISHTIVAHIAKDGHYYIHPDITQNRSITVREAARIQTFSDDFFFENSRTSAFKQIGNAVPPLLSSKFADLISNNYY